MSAPASGTKQLKKGDLLFREGDTSDSMFVIKSGKIAITKAKGSSEVVLAELGPGDMLGEMAFFDNKPRSAGAKAIVDTDVIVLPFAALNAQFKTFPEWLKAIVRTVNTHLRNANMRIKNLEKSQEEDEQVFPPHTMTRLTAILCMTAHKYGEATAAGVELNGATLRRYTIQIFQQPTNKMQTLMEVLQSFGHLKIEDLGEGRQKIVVNNISLLFDFVDYYNDYLFKEDSKRITVEEKEMRPLKALIHYGKLATPNDKGLTKVNLTQAQNDSMKDLGYLFSVDDINTLTEKKLVGEKVSEEGGAVSVTFKLDEVQRLYPFWEIIFALRKIQR